MRRQSFLSLLLVASLALITVSCSNSDDTNYYYSDSAPVGPDGQPIENQDVSSGSNSATYTQRRPVSSEPKPWATAEQEKAPVVRYPTGTKVSGKPGLVKSPYAPYAGDVDVKGYAAGTQVKCPYTGKIFIVP
ncbi:MAG: hypothetical protein AAF571_03865 [Verrucomicrobiota bacterium]